MSGSLSEKQKQRFMTTADAEKGVGSPGYLMYNVVCTWGSPVPSGRQTLILVPVEAKLSFPLSLRCLGK